MKPITMNTDGDVVKEYPMNPRHEITKEYNSNPRHQRRWELTIEWLKQFGIKGKCLDCGDFSELTFAIALNFIVKIKNTIHNLDEGNHSTWGRYEFGFDNIFIFEVIEHLLNPLVFLDWVEQSLKNDGNVFLSTPINRPKWMRNKELHFHEFNYNELCYLIDESGFKIVDEKRINCTTWKMITGFRPLLRFFGIDKNILLRLRRK